MRIEKIFFFFFFSIRSFQEFVGPELHYLVVYVAEKDPIRIEGYPRNFYLRTSSMLR